MIGITASDHSNNVFRDMASRVPRVRYGQVHLFNNYYVGAKSLPVYANSYSVGVGQAAKILSTNNVFEVSGALACPDVVKNFSGSIAGAFKDTGLRLNGAALGNCVAPASATWTPPYAFSPRPILLPSAASGWREYGTTDLAGVPPDLAIRGGGFEWDPQP